MKNDARLRRFRKIMHARPHGKGHKNPLEFFRDPACTKPFYSFRDFAFLDPGKESTTDIYVKNTSERLLTELTFESEDAEIRMVPSTTRALPGDVVKIECRFSPKFDKKDGTPAFFVTYQGYKWVEGK